MTKQEKIDLIQKCIDDEKAFHLIMDKIEELFEDPFGNLFDTWTQAMGNYTDAVSATVGDRGEWLSWYLCENDCGRKGLEAGYDGEVREIKSIDDLLWLIEKSGERG